MKVSTILDNIDQGAIALPEFQRGYVWNRAQVRGLMSSLYRGYPVGGLLTWLTSSDTAAAKGDGKVQPGFVSLLLDGQQRVTSLYGIVRGRAPQFFEGNAGAFDGLRFHLLDETFEFFQPVKMKDDPLWIDVTTAMQPSGDESVLKTLGALELGHDAFILAARLNRLRNILATELHIEQVTGDEMTTDIVVEIFNRVNSGGTKLSKGDLALARICATWPDARAAMRAPLERWKNAGFSFGLDWLLRNINAIVTGRAEFSYLAEIDVATFEEGLARAERSIDELLNLISGRLGLDHLRVLGGYAAFPVMSRYLAERNWKLQPGERDRLLYWYVNSFLAGRYAGSTETVLNADIAALDGEGDALEKLILLLRQTRRDLAVHPDEFQAWSVGARFYPLLYMLTRVHDVLDWRSGVPLKQELLGKLAGLELHHIFPKEILYKAGYGRPEVNALANFTFLTKATNLEVTNRDPVKYIPAYDELHPGVMVSHWIPMDPELWKVDNYPAFLAERRRLLADAANGFLDRLGGGTAADVVVGAPVVGEGSYPGTIKGPVTVDDEGRVIADCRDWVTSRGFAAGVENYELVDAGTGEALAILDLAWPDGLQTGLTGPVALLLNESSEVERVTSALGYRFFTSASDLQEYVETLAFDDEDAA